MVAVGMRSAVWDWHHLVEDGFGGAWQFHFLQESCETTFGLLAASGSISTMMLASVKVGKYRRSDSSTLTMMSFARHVPTAVLLVRPGSRSSWAGPRSVRSASLLVPDTGWLCWLGWGTAQPSRR